MMGRTVTKIGRLITMENIKCIRLKSLMPYLFFMSFGQFFLHGCTLKESLYGVSPADGYIQSDADVAVLANGIYAEYQSYSLYKSSAHGMILFSADEFSTPSFANQGYWLSHSELSTDTYINSSWNNFFAAINRSNSLIESINTAGSLVTAATRKKVIGEMYFMRGFTYFNLVRLFGGVPVSLSSSQPNNNFSQPRQSIDSVYHQIFIDLSNANQMCIPYSLQPTAERGRATKGAAQAILALAYLTYANYCDLNNRSSESPKYYTLANSFSDSVINSNQYRLLPNYASIFDVSNEPMAYNEVIFGIQQTRDFTTANQNSKGSQMAYTTTSGNEPYVCGNPTNGYGAGTVQIQPWFYDLYRSGDYTKNGVNDYRTDYNFLTNWYSTTSIPISHFVTYPVVVADSQYLTRKNQPYFNKYRDPNGLDYWNNENDEYIIRLAEVYLIKAEALNELGQPGIAWNIFMTVRRRARLADGNPRSVPADLPLGLSKADFRMAVFNERGLELAGEFSRWFDCVRMQYGNTGKCMLQWRFETFYPQLASNQMTLPVWNSSAKKWVGGTVQPVTVIPWIDKYKLFPIPAAELAANANFGNQNPGW